MARSAERAPAEQRSDEIEERRGEERRYVMHQGRARSSQCAARSALRRARLPRSEATRQRSGATMRQGRARSAQRKPANERRCVKGE